MSVRRKWSQEWETWKKEEDNGRGGEFGGQAKKESVKIDKIMKWDRLQKKKTKRETNRKKE